MMSANSSLNHFPPTSWTFYTAEGAEAAGKSNLALGDAGPDAITALMQDSDGSGSLNSQGANAPVGHRRWFLYPQTREMGTGDVPGNSTLLAANATWVQDGLFGTARPATRTTQVAYPPAGFVPYQIVWPRWSFSYPAADFSSATVAMTRNGAAIAVRLEAVQTGFGENTLVWVYDNLSTATSSGHAKPTADVTYTVNISNVRIGNAAQNFSYNVTVFDPDVAGADFVPVAVTGSATPGVNVANNYTVAKPGFAGGFEWRASQLAAFTKIYDAENGLDGISTTTSAGYAVVQSGVTGAGTASFHVAHPSPTSNQILTLPDLFYVEGASASLSFLSRLGFASNNQVARVQVSTDDTSWSDIYAQAGTSDAGETTFRSRSASLASFAGRTVRIRFNYTISASGSFFPQTTSGVGWYFDNISVAGVQRMITGPTTSVASGSTFAFTPAATGTVALQARGVLFDAYPLEWGPVTIVNAVPGGGGNSGSSYLSNLSVRTAAGTGAQTLIVGFAVSGGTKPLLVRGIGPALTAFGVGGALADPKLELFNGATKITENDNWDASAAATFATVGAFALTNGSRDAALVTSLGAGSYTAQVSGVGGTTGTTLVELYDAAAGVGSAKLTNVSARTQVGTGGDILIAGFNIAGTGARTLLIRAVGPTLSVFGVTGTLADPKLELYSAQGTKLQENDNWEVAAGATFSQVGAFNLTANSRDAVLLVTLQPGTYTAQLSGVGNTTGVALVEIYEVP